MAVWIALDSTIAILRHRAKDWFKSLCIQSFSSGRLRLKFDGTRAGTRFRLSAKRTSPFKPAGASVQSTTGSRGVRTSGSNAGYTVFRGCVQSTGQPLHSPIYPSLPLPCVMVCRHISTALYQKDVGLFGKKQLQNTHPCVGPRINRKTLLALHVHCQLLTHFSDARNNKVILHEYRTLRNQWTQQNKLCPELRTKRHFFL